MRAKIKKNSRLGEGRREDSKEDEALLLWLPSASVARETQVVRA